MEAIAERITEKISQNKDVVFDGFSRINEKVNDKISNLEAEIKAKQKILESINPEAVLKRGYAIISGRVIEGETVKAVTFDKEIEAKINKISKRKA